jgi:hypothetical protein
MTPQVAQRTPYEVRHVNNLEVVHLEADLQPHMLALGGHDKGPQGRVAVMRVGGGEDRRVAGRSPSVPSRGDEQNPTFIQAGQVSPQAPGFFASPARVRGSWGSTPIGCGVPKPLGNMGVWSSWSIRCCT